MLKAKKNRFFGLKKGKMALLLKLFLKKHNTVLRGSYE